MKFEPSAPDNVRLCSTPRENLISNTNSDSTVMKNPPQLSLKMVSKLKQIPIKLNNEI